MTPLDEGLLPDTGEPVEVDKPVLPLPRTRFHEPEDAPSSSTTNVPFRPQSLAASAIFASTTSFYGSGSTSPHVGPNGSALIGASPGANSQRSSDYNGSSDIRDLIQHAFVPTIAVYTSTDTDNLTTEKGFEGGLWQLLRPFGESVHGKVTVRDSVGLSRSYDDFFVRFVKLGSGLNTGGQSDSLANPATDAGLKSETGRHAARNSTLDGPNLKTGVDIAAIERLVDQHLAFAEHFSEGNAEDYINFKNSVQRDEARTSPFYLLYLQRLLSGIPLVPYETFSHPVACVIAISSRNPNPIEALRQLYEESSRGERGLPKWVNQEYLRYYVLVHDEEKDDISKSSALFEQMKRHFGLHCHLLRLRSSQCILTDDDAVAFPKVDWTSASEELTDIRGMEMKEDMEEAILCFYESDATALKTFVRELVTQSVVPSMERCIATWNDQIASRRRGIGGRLMNITKGWTGFGAVSRKATTSTAATNSSYDMETGIYPPEASEALLRKLGDYAFMLRDWKLAQSTYELCRGDYNNDKAWRYHAAANEMAALSVLMNPTALSAKTRGETVDQMLELATYSYISRCSDPYGALRCLALALELLKTRGGSATDDAARWGARLLEIRVLHQTGDALVKERIAACYASRKGTGLQLRGARLRKAALWNILAADAWLAMNKVDQARQRMTQVDVLYNSLAAPRSLQSYDYAQRFLLEIHREIQAASHPSGITARNDSTAAQRGTSVDEGEESEALDARRQPRSMVAKESGGPATSLLGHVASTAVRSSSLPFTNREAAGHVVEDSMS